MGTVNTEGFVWKFLCAVYKFPFIHSFIHMYGVVVCCLVVVFMGFGWNSRFILLANHHVKTQPRLTSKRFRFQGFGSKRVGQYLASVVL